MNFNFVNLIATIKEDPDLEGLDFSILRTDYRKMMALLMFRKKNQYKTIKQLEFIMKLIKSRTYLDSMIVRCKSFFDPVRNIYIEDIEKSHGASKALTTYVGISQARIDILMEEFRVLDNQMTYTANPIAPAKIHMLRETILEYADNFVIFSLGNAYKKFKEFDPDKNKTKDGKTIKKDRLLFSYFFFLEFFRVADYFGNFARQVAMSGASTKLRSLETTTQGIKSPPSLPSNVQYEPETEESIHEAITDPFQELENESEF